MCSSIVDRRDSGRRLWRLGVSMALIAILVLQVILIVGRKSVAPALAQQVAVDDRGRPVYPYILREVQNTVSKNAKALQECYLGYLARSPGVREGRLTYDWFVGVDGRAERVEFIAGSFGDDRFRSDVKVTVERMEFPPPTSPTYVDYTFSFKDVGVQSPASPSNGGGGMRQD